MIKIICNHHNFLILLLIVLLFQKKSQVLILLHILSCENWREGFVLIIQMLQMMVIQFLQLIQIRSTLIQIHNFQSLLQSKIAVKMVILIDTNGMSGSCNYLDNMMVGCTTLIFYLQRWLISLIWKVSKILAHLFPDAINHHVFVGNAWLGRRNLVILQLMLQHLMSPQWKNSWKALFQS